MERRHDFARESLDADDFADWVFAAEELILDGAAQNANIGGAVDVVLGEQRTFADSPCLDGKELQRIAAIHRVPVAVSVNDLGAGIDIGRDSFQQRYLIADGVRIVPGERRGALRPGANAIDRAAAALDPDQIVAKIAELLLDLPLRCFADGDDTDSRADADADAKHGEQTPRCVAKQRFCSRAQQRQDIHGRDI